MRKIKIGLSMKAKDFLKKLQSQPESTKKIILWSVMVLVGLLLLIFWLNSTKSRIKNFQKEDFVRDLGIPDLREDINKMPKIEFPEITMPELNEEELKALDEELEGAGSVQESEGSI